MPIVMHSRGSFKRSHNFLKRITGLDIRKRLSEYGKKGVEALSVATPVDTGKTASSWYYKIDTSVNGATLSWFNSNINEGVPIALVIEYGHVTGWGGYVPPYPYIEQALAPVISALNEEVWRDYTNVD